jgi:hypothetical protein
MSTKTIVQLPVASGITTNDVLLLRQGGSDKQAGASGVCLIQENQTVSGTKTFDSIPILPASDPTTDNQAARKKYVDDNFTEISSGAGAPGITPTKVGDIYIDTTGDRVYIAKGTASSADWEKKAKYEYGTVTVTAAGGDVTINLDWDWTDGILLIVRTDTSSEYFHDGADALYITTYDALTDAGFTTDNIIGFDPAANAITTRDKSTTISGLPNAATSTSFSLDDDGANTVFVKWMVIA